MKKEYKKVYDQIELSEEIQDKLINMNPTENRIIKCKVHYAAVAALVVGVIITSDFATYAATGKTVGQHIATVTEDNSNTITVNETGDAELKDGTILHIETNDNSGFEQNLQEVQGEDGSEVHVNIYDKNSDNNTNK